RGAGLVDVETEGQVWTMRPGMSVTQFYRVSWTQLADRLVGAGLLTAQEMEQYLALHDDPAFVSLSNILMGAWGRRTTSSGPPPLLDSASDRVGRWACMAGPCAPQLCPGCRFENSAGAKFCGACGAALTPACPRCGTKNPSAFKFCSECGSALATAQATLTASHLRSEAVARLIEEAARLGVTAWPG